MAERRQKIRGTTLELDQVIGSQGLLAVDYEKNNLRLYDGVTLGGFKILNATELAALYTLPDRLRSDGILLGDANRSANEAIQNGWYTVVATVTDLPVAAAGTIHVSTSRAGQITQVYSPDAVTAQYVRVRTAANVWGAWRKTVSTYDLADPASGVSAYNATRLGGELPAYYTAINARLGYTAANKAGDVFSGNVGVTGRIDATGDIVAAGIVRAGGASAGALTATGNIQGTQWTAGANSNLADWLTANKVSKSGDVMSGALTMQAPITMTRPDVGGSVSRAIYSDGTAVGFVKSDGTWAVKSDNNGDLSASNRVFANGAYLNTDGNISGSAWNAWGSTSAFDAISARIEARSQAWANDRLVKLSYRLTARNIIAGRVGGEEEAPSGGVLTGVAAWSTSPGRVYSVYYRYAQVYDPVRGWVGFVYG